MIKKIHEYFEWSSRRNIFRFWLQSVAGVVILWSEDSSRGAPAEWRLEDQDSQHTTSLWSVLHSVRPLSSPAAHHRQTDCQLLSGQHTPPVQAAVSCPPPGCPLAVQEP